jgi:hypothetical protein
VSTAQRPQGTVPAGDGRRRRRIWLSVLAAVVVAALVAVLLLTRGSDDPHGSGSSTTSSPSLQTAPRSPTEAPLGTTPAPGATDPNAPPTTLAPVALDGRGDVGNGVVTTLPAIDAIQSSAQGPGNIAGPALRVTVRIKNGTADAIPLDGVTVNLYYGTDRTPASPEEDPSRAPFSGTLAPGASADGIYVFSVPSNARDSVTVELGYIPGAPILLFTGKV